MQRSTITETIITTVKNPKLVITVNKTTLNGKRITIMRRRTTIILQTAAGMLVTNKAQCIDLMLKVDQNKAI